MSYNHTHWPLQFVCKHWDPAANIAESKLKHACSKFLLRFIQFQRSPSKTKKGQWWYITEKLLNMKVAPVIRHSFGPKYNAKICMNTCINHYTQNGTMMFFWAGSVLPLLDSTKKFLIHCCNDYDELLWSYQKFIFEIVKWVWWAYSTIWHVLGKLKT